MSRLDRFTRAQDQIAAGFTSALAELRAGRKTGHWIWYVFPQLAGLGHSNLSRTFGIASVDEAVEYLCDPVLGSRLLAATTALADHVRAGKRLEDMMGSSVDVMKLVSSLTLFGHLAAALYADERLEAHRSLADAANVVLNAAASEGYPRCSYTLARLT